MRLTAATVFLCLIVSPAHSHQFNCTDVRAYVAKHGRAAALAAALAHGATWAEIRKAKRCLKQ